MKTVASVKAAFLMYLHKTGLLTVASLSSYFSAVREDRMPGGRNGSAIYHIYKVSILSESVSLAFSVSYILGKNTHGNNADLRAAALSADDILLSSIFA